MLGDGDQFGLDSLFLRDPVQLEESYGLGSGPMFIGDFRNRVAGPECERGVEHGECSYGFVGDDTGSETCWRSLSNR